MIIVAIIGCGSIANAEHIPSYLNCPDVEIKYFCDIIPERAEAAVKKYSCGTAITDYHKILNDPEVSAVSICTPNRAHSTITIDCLKAGKNVLCEKPAAINLEQAIKMQNAQHETKKILNIGVVNRFDKSVNKIKEMIDNGLLGNIYHVYASFRAYRSIPGLGGAFTTKEIAGGGALIDWGIHYIDIVMYCCGDPTPKTVTGDTFSKLGKDIPNYVYRKMWAGPPVLDGVYDVEDSMTGIIRTEGPTISLHGAWAQNIGINENYIDFMGDKGGIRLNYATKEFTFYTTKDGKLTEETYQTDRTVVFDEMFQNEINAFIESVKTGKKISSHIDNVIKSAKIIQAIYDSSDRKEEIKL